MFGSDDKDKMHPQDLRNMFIFFVLAALIYFTFDALVLKPQNAALQKKRVVEQQIKKTEDATKLKPLPPKPRALVLQENQRVTLDNGRISGSIELRGARLDDIAFSDYYDTIEKKNKVVLLSPKNTEFPRYIEYGWVADDKNLQVPGPDTAWRTEGNSRLAPGNPVTLVWDNGQGVRFENIYSIDENYAIALTQKVVNNSGRSITLNPYGLVSQTGVPPGYHPVWVVHEGPVGFIGKKLEEFSYSSMHKEPSHSYDAERGWAGITDKYWLTALIPPQDKQIHYRYTYSGTPPKNAREKDTGKYQVDFLQPSMTVVAGQSVESTSHIYTGVKKVLLLQEYGKKLNIPNFDLAVDFGWFWFLAKPFFYLLHFLSSATGNFGIGLILLTIVARSAVFPLTNFSYKSFAKMKKVAPQVAELRKAHNDDKKKLQEELVKLYEREGVNPLSGCLPILVQIPIFFALYKVLITTIEMRHAPFYGWIHDLSAPDPTNIFTLFGLFDWTLPSFIHPMGIWPCFLMVMFYMQKTLAPPPQDPIQRDMMYYFPFLMAYLMANFASGLVIYWTLSAAIGIMQQIIIMKSMGVPIYLFGEREEEAELEKEVDKGPALHPLVDMAEKKVEEALFPEKPVTPPKPKKKKKK